MARIRPLETVERALEVFRALNLLGGATVSGLARFTGVPRAAVNRYVVTFASLGYAHRARGGKAYRVSAQALELASGIKSDDWVRLDAEPEMFRLCRKIGWPIGLETIRDARLAILANTDEASPFVSRPISKHLRLPIVGRASGHVQLAQMAPNLRRDVLAAALDADPALFRRVGMTSQKLARELEAVRGQGYALQRVLRANWSVVAVPIKTADSMGFSLSARFRPKALGAAAVIDVLVPQLTATAKLIAEKIARPNGAAPRRGTE